jgi:phosphoribosyl-AMP cyclohydrolase
VPLRDADDPAGAAYALAAMDTADLAAQLTLTDDGLIPAIVQQHDTGEVLMMAWMTPTTLAETIELGETVFWSRSRAERWHKGATSGNVQAVVSIDVDCDADVLLIRVDQGDGVACHTGARTCFRPLTGSDSPAGA